MGGYENGPDVISANLKPAHLKLDIGNRITLPKYISDRISWLNEGSESEAWLWVVEEGRYRLLSNADVDSDPQLHSIRALIRPDGRIERVIATRVVEANRTALIARLIPVDVKKHGSSCRIPIPKDVEIFAPPTCNLKSFSVLLSPEGYWEIWYTDLLRKAALNGSSEL